MKLWKTLTGAGVALLIGTGAPYAAEDWIPKDLPKPLAEVTIGFSALGAGVNSYVATYIKTFEAYAAELGVKVVTLDAQADPAKQSDQIKDLIAQQVDAMVIWPVNAVAVVPSVKLVHDAKIPVIITNSQIDASGADYFDAFTGPDNIVQAQSAGEMMAKALGGKGNVVIIGGLPGYSVSQEREKGFLDAIAKYPDIRVLDTQPGNWSREKAQSTMENFIVRFGDTIDGVYSADSDMGIGALAAIQAAEAEGTIPAGHIKLTDATLFGAAYDAIKAGTYTGSVLQSPVEDAKIALKMAILAAEGQEIEKMNFFASPSITADNINDYERPNF